MEVIPNSYLCQVKKIILSTAYFPPIEYFAAIAKADEIIIETQETYPKQTYRNRCRISTANGILDLSIPVKKVNGNHTITKDILSSEKENWRIKHWRAIESAYNASAFFLYYKDEIKELTLNPETNLIEYNSNMLSSILNILGINTNIRYSESYIKQYEDLNDLRNTISPKVKSVRELPEYFQVFNHKFPFQSNLSILDLLFNEGPATLSYLESI